MTRTVRCCHDARYVVCPQQCFEFCLKNHVIFVDNAKRKYFDLIIFPEFIFRYAGNNVVRNSRTNINMQRL